MNAVIEHFKICIYVMWNILTFSSCIYISGSCSYVKLLHVYRDIVEVTCFK